MSQHEFEIRHAKKEEYVEIGQLMVEVYSKLEGFPNPIEQPDYYDTLRNVGKLTDQDNTALLVAVSDREQILGAVVYFSDMKNYGSGGIAPEIKNSSGFRLLTVGSGARGMGIGKLLSQECIDRTKQLNQKQLIIHSTKSMKIAWSMYERMGFERYPKIDFIQGELPVYGFRLKL
jgi:ribosomal protein S18 acetylase RimI-like enzyme